ncbi:MAG: ribonuclease P protein component [Thermoanaerobaculaceae bacterium]|nr:ribonuclease P protein component [Thermoanaerobaculaceae bacterium]
MELDQRLRRRSEFQLVYQQGVRVAGRCLVIFGLCRPGGRCRLGITATRKIGPAVVRNRARRRVRELFRRHEPRGQWEGDVVVNVRRACAEAPWQELEQDFTQCLAKIVRRATPSAPPSVS